MFWSLFFWYSQYYSLLIQLLVYLLEHSIIMAMSDEEVRKLVACFESLGAKPKLDNPQDLKLWMEDYVRGQDRSAGISHYGDPSTSGDDATPASPSAKTTHILHTPKIFAFSGEGDKKETAFESWQYEIKTLLREGSFSIKTVTTAAKKSLRGEAAKVVRRLGVDSTIDQILDKLQIIYGRVEDPSDLLTEFHKATQEPTESVSTWCCRIEDLLYRALETDPDHINKPEETLRRKFYSGLRQDIKSRIRHLKDTLRSFDKLLHEARRAEMEDKSLAIDKPKIPAQLKMTNADDSENTSEMATLKGTIHALNTKVDAMASTLKELKDSSQTSSWQSTNNYRGGYRGKSRWNNQGRNQNWNQTQVSTSQDGTQSTQPVSTSQVSQSRRPVICHRCGQEGHKAYGCCVDLPSQSLNKEESV